MAKSKNQFVCSGCGHIEYKWVGRCIQCGEWNSFQEEAYPGNTNRKQDDHNSDGPKKLCDISEDAYERVATGVKEFDRVVGGGLVKGSLLLVGGEPGIGKSTLLMEICGKLSNLFTSEKNSLCEWRGERRASGRSLPAIGSRERKFVDF